MHTTDHLIPDLPLLSCANKIVSDFEIFEQAQMRGRIGKKGVLIDFNP